MRITRILLIFTLILSIGCSNKELDAQFVKKVSGKYLYNLDEVIEVYAIDNTLFLKWRGAEKIEPVSMGENIFFVKEMNEKIQFLTNPTDNNQYISIVPKDNTNIGYDFKKITTNKLLPSEYLKNNDLDNAIKGYLAIQQKDAVSEFIKEVNFNRLGYNNLTNNNIKNAITVFKINVALHPESSNVYDSLADALFQNKDTIGAIKNYKKALELDSGNPRAKRFIKKYDSN